MCGIAGAVWTDRRAEEPSSLQLTERMVESLGHRGPDGRGVRRCSGADGSDGEFEIALGHTRLAILDLSDRASQPMTLEDSRTCVTFNGEIYNFRELKRDLAALGHRFVTESDTEVVMCGYRQWGADVVRRLRGIFAFAIWDATLQQLFLARDHFGVKPLYTWQRGRAFCFASEIRALLATGMIDRRFDPGAIERYLMCQTVPTPRTLVEGVRLLRPGHYLTISAGPNIVERQYWDLLEDAESNDRITPDDARMQVGELLTQSIQLNLVSDVPVGIFLSGGIDSSALVALTRKAGATPQTLSVTLPGSQHDEGPYAREVAERFDASHIEIALTADDFRDRLPAGLSAVDHPSGDGLNTFVVSAAARQAGFKVALSGLGGDELFGGYPSFRRLRRLKEYAPVWQRSPQVVRDWAAAAVRGFGRSVGASKAAAVLEGDGSIPHAFPILRQLFDDGQRRRLLGREASADVDDYSALLRDAVRKHPSVEPMALVSYAEARTYMHDVLLRDTDQMSMAHGLEVRVPLLDHRLATFVIGLRDGVKMASTLPKSLLVESLGGILPAGCVDRPKQGFVLPFERWMKGELRDLCQHHLGRDGIASRTSLDPGAVQTLWDDFLRGTKSTTWSRPWALVALNAWAEQHKIAQ